MSRVTQLQIATDALFSQSHLCLNKTVPYTQSIPVGNDEVPFGVSLFARAMHDDSETGGSEWSKTNTFKVIPPVSSVGICMYGTGSRSGDFRRIDAAGNFIQDFNYQSHATYAQKMRDVVVDNCQMKEFDTIYVKTAVSGPAGSDAAGKKCWWVSTEKLDDTYRVHPAFKRDGVIKPKIWISRYLGYNDGNKLGSAPSKSVQTSKSRADFKVMCAARNTGGVSGFRCFDIYDMALLRLYLLIYGGGTDMQTIWGDNTAGTTNPSTGSTGAAALGIHDLWRCYWYHIDNISVSASGAVTLTDPSTGGAITTNRSVPADKGWMVDILDGVITIGGTDHNIMELFLPKTINATEANGSFSDYYALTTASDMRCGTPSSLVEEYQSYEVTGTRQEQYQNYEQTGTKQEEYQNHEMISKGRVVYSHEPNGETVYYETGSTFTGCYYFKCAIGYAYFVNNGFCELGHKNTGTWASGWPACPHGYIVDSGLTTGAHCDNDSGAGTVGYRAPCGRTTHKTEDQWGYVTRTRTVPVYGYVTRTRTVDVYGYVTRTRNVVQTTQCGIFSAIIDSIVNATVAARLSKH